MYGFEETGAVGGFQQMTQDMLTVLNDIPFSIPPTIRVSDVAPPNHPQRRSSPPAPRATGTLCSSPARWSRSRVLALQSTPTTGWCSRRTFAARLLSEDRPGAARAAAGAAPEDERGGDADAPRRARNRRRRLPGAALSSGRGALRRHLRHRRDRLSSRREAMRPDTPPSLPPPDPTSLSPPHRRRRAARALGNGGDHRRRPAAAPGSAQVRRRRRRALRSRTLPSLPAPPNPDAARTVCHPAVGRPARPLIVPPGARRESRVEAHGEEELYAISLTDLVKSTLGPDAAAVSGSSRRSRRCGCLAPSPPPRVVTPPPRPRAPPRVRRRRWRRPLASSPTPSRAAAPRSPPPTCRLLRRHGDDERRRSRGGGGRAGPEERAALDEARGAWRRSCSGGSTSGWRR